MDDFISRQAAIDEIEYELEMINSALDSITLDFNARERLRQRSGEAREILNSIQQLPSAQPERLTDDDFETIRIHLNAYKEKLCNQQRWKEADEYQRIIDRFMAFASAQPEISQEYAKAVFAWLLDYQIKVAELKGRYTPYEVLSWVANDWRKENR